MVGRRVRRRSMPEVDCLYDTERRCVNTKRHSKLLEALSLARKCVLQALFNMSSRCTYEHPGGRPKQHEQLPRPKNTSRGLFSWSNFGKYCHSFGALETG